MSNAKRDRLAVEISPLDSAMQDALISFNAKKYGPRFCASCNKVQPVEVYELQGSHKYKTEGYVLTETFTGAYVCRVCHNTIKALEGDE